MEIYVNNAIKKEQQILKKKYDTSEIIDSARRRLASLGCEMTDEEALGYIEQMIFDDSGLAALTPDEVVMLVHRVYCAVRKDLDILDPLVNDTEITEIMINGRDNIFIERNGVIEKSELGFESTEDLEEIIRRIASKVHREINELRPIVDARLRDGSRVNAVYKNVAFGGPVMTIRKFPEKAYTMEDMIKFGTVTEECARFLKVLVRSGYNIFISGGTSSGKTTLLNALAGYIPRSERVVVIEDSLELRIDDLENIVRLECKNANMSGKGRVTMQQLIKSSLRMRPDRIIVGEVRGEEVMDMINAMNTGHDGSLSTGHGNSIEGMLRRLESMFLQAADFPIEAIRAQIVEGIDVFVHLGRLEGKGRRILGIAEVEGIDCGEIILNPLYSYRPGEGLVKTRNRLKHREKLELKGEADEYRLLGI